MAKKINRDRSVVKVAYFVSPHGFGHAARAAAVMEAIGVLKSNVCFEIFTTVPSWFFKESLTVPFSCHAVLTDIGVVQQTALQGDLVKTVSALDRLLPYAPDLVSSVARDVERLGCQIVLCDIAPLGILVAGAVGLPCVLVENFTWDWIYRKYLHSVPAIVRHISYLENIYGCVDFHVQTKPVCRYDDGADLVTEPVSRRARASREEMRRRLGVSPDKKVVLISMTGAGQSNAGLRKVSHMHDTIFIIPGGSFVETRRDNLRLLPLQSSYYHPDLVSGCDGVIGKLGYSTLAEAYHGSIPFGYIERPNFRETRILANFVEENMAGMAIEEKVWKEGNWPNLLGLLLQRSPTYGKRGQKSGNGADEIAHFVAPFMTGN